MPHLHRLAVALIVIAAAAGLLLPPARRDGHGPGTAAHAAHGGPTNTLAMARPVEALPKPAQAAPPRPAFDLVKAAAVARAAGANELGQVPVLMIHRVLPKPRASLDRTPAQLYEEFTRLAREDYVPVTAAEFVTGRMNVPAGRHPVVLTFDDGSDTQLAFDAQGAPRPDTAVGVILRVAREHPGFRPVATFFVNRDPFAPGEGGATALRWLVRHGFEVANHTTHHQDLAGKPRAKVQEEIGTDQRAIEAATGVPPVTFAFPYGALSHLNWADHGSARGVPWAFQGMFLAGWRPADSPFAKSYDPRLIPRIRDQGKVGRDGCKRFCSAAWLDWLAKNPGKRYTSDGNPDTVAFPQSKMIYLARGFQGMACPY